jgi:hypothetical protein
MFFNRTYLDLLFLLRESLLDFDPLAPGNWICVAACWALTRAELSLGFRVDVPKNESISIRDFYALVSVLGLLLLFDMNHESIDFFRAPTQTDVFSVCLMTMENNFANDFWAFPGFSFDGM